MSDKKQMSSYQRAIQKLAIYENAIKEAIDIIQGPKDMGSKWRDDALEAKSVLLQAIVRVYNL